MTSAAIRFSQLCEQVRLKNPNLVSSKLIDKIKSENPALWKEYSDEVGAASPDSKSTAATTSLTDKIAGITAGQRVQIAMEDILAKHPKLSRQEAYAFVKIQDPKLIDEYSRELGFDESDQPTKDQWVPAN